MQHSIAHNLDLIRPHIPAHVTLVAVSKTKPVSMLMEAYDAGVRDFGENKVQEMVEKQAQLPADIRWHLIGHLQSNKVKYIAPFVHLIHSVDSEKLLDEINKQALKNSRVINCLLQVHIAREETKFGLDETELLHMVQTDFLKRYPHVQVCGLMGMATFTDDVQQIRAEFGQLKKIFDQLKTTVFSANEHFKVLSMGMSGDYELAIAEGSTLVRVGSSIFGSRAWTFTLSAFWQPLAQ